MLIDIATSTLSSTARGWRGTSAMVRTAQPEHWLVLYDMEGCPYCRTVREVLTELDLNVFIKPCPKGQPGFREELAQLSGKGQVPYLVDENTGQSMAGSDQITRYLYEKYGAESKPEKKGKFLRPLNKLATGLRFMRGLRGVKASRPEKPLILFSFESLAQRYFADGGITTATAMTCLLLMAMAKKTRSVHSQWYYVLTQV